MVAEILKKRKSPHYPLGTHFRNIPCCMYIFTEISGGQMIEKDLVYDVGMHDGSDTMYYLHKGYRVVAIDANPDLIEKANKLFSGHIASGKLTLLNIAIAEKEETVTFNISKNDVWSSMDKDIAGREGNFLKQINVEARKLSTIFKTHGTPVYCKIDIEGYDAIALQSISAEGDIPEYISVETESIAEGITITEAEALYTLELLRGLGYSKYKLVDQSTMEPLKPNEQFYFEPEPVNMSLPARGIRFLKRKLLPAKVNNYRTMLSEKEGFAFKHGTTGPWGADIAGEWHSYEVAKTMLLRHRKEYMQRTNAIDFGFWCDWHAKK